MIRFERDTYECNGEGFLTGRISVNNINCSNLVLIGIFNVKGIVVSNDIVVIGSGFINFLTCISGLIVSYSKPIVINKLYCRKLYVIGSRHPVVVKYSRVGEAYLINSFFDELESIKLYINRRVCISKLNKCSEVVFKNPYCWIEELNCKPVKTIFQY